MLVTTYKDDDTQGMKGTLAVAELVGELVRLRKELAQAKREAEIRKKATACFAWESHPGLRS